MVDIFLNRSLLGGHALLQRSANGLQLTIGFNLSALIAAGTLQRLIDAMGSKLQLLYPRLLASPARRSTPALAQE